MHDLSRSQSVSGKDFPTPLDPSAKCATRAGRRLFLAAAFSGLVGQTLSADEPKPNNDTTHLPCPSQ